MLHKNARLIYIFIQSKALLPGTFFCATAKTHRNRSRYRRHRPENRKDFNTTNSATIAAISTTWNAQFLSTVAIPEKDTATQTAFEAVLNPWLLATGVTGGNITCSADNDQDLSGYEHN